MADQITNAQYDLIDKGIKAAKEEFKKGFKAPQEATLDKKIEQIFKQDLLNYARSIRTHYHFLQEDAAATAKADKNALDYFREISPLTSKRFEELDKSYATLAPALAKNIGTAVEIQAIMNKLAKYQNSLKGDLSQKDSFLDEVIKKSVLEANVKDKKEPKEKELKKQEDDLSAALKEENQQVDEVLKLAAEVDKVVNDLNGDAFLEPLSKINFPALNINFKSFDSAVVNLSKNLADNVKTFDKAKDTALADYLKVQVAAKTSSANEILEQLYDPEPAPDNSKTKTKIEKAQANADALQVNIDTAKAQLNALNTILVNKQLEEQNIKTYHEALDQTYEQIEALKIKKNHLNSSFVSVLGGNNFKGLAERLGTNVKTLLGTVKKLESVCKAVSNMIDKLSAKDVTNDVQEYLNQFNKALSSLGEPIKNLSLLTLNNIGLLEQLQSSVEALNKEYFQDLNALFEKSSLNEDKLKLAPKEKEKLDLGLKSDLNSPIADIKKEIKATTLALEKLSQDSLIENNKVNFLKSIGAAA